MMMRKLGAKWMKVIVVVMMRALGGNERGKEREDGRSMSRSSIIVRSVQLRNRNIAKK